MHVAIVGAGALGSVYGARLVAPSARTGVDVTFVHKPGRARAPSPIRVERVDDGEAHAIEAPRFAQKLPAPSDVIVVCVRYESLGDELTQTLAAGPDAPIVVMTPMLPRDRDAMRAALGERVIAAMPGVTAYRNDAGVVRYWQPRSTTTAIDELRPMPPAATELATALERAGLRTEIAMGVHEKAPATAIAFAPIAAAIDIAGSVDAALDDGELLQVALDAAHEARELSRSVGEIATAPSLLLKFLSKLTIKMTVAVARRQAPEALGYVENRFGRASRAQNVALMSAVIALAEEKGAARGALESLRARLVVA